MKKETKPIDDAHVTAVGEQLDHALAKGPAPPRARTRQALIDLYASKLIAMRQAHFSLEEIANALSHKDVVFSTAMVSTYCSRSSALNASISATAKRTKSRTSNGTPPPRTRPLKQPRQKTGADAPPCTEHPDQTVTPTSSPSPRREGHETAKTAKNEQANVRAMAPDTRKISQSESRTGIGWMDKIG